MKYGDLFRHYDSLVKSADRAFQRMAADYDQEIKCTLRCSDCCHALFGLFLVEAYFLKEAFDALDRKVRRKILKRCDKADRDLLKIEEKLEMTGYTGVDALGKERVRCPLLSEDRVCCLYSHRPITCRVYGIPTAIRGKARVCQKTGFRAGRSYPVFDLDQVQKELYLLSRELLIRHGAADTEQAALLISVSKALRMPLEDIAAGSLT